CVPVGFDAGLSFAASSRCKLGASLCDGGCLGFVGPAPETCDGVDNDCNGAVDDVVDPAGHRVGDPCCAFGARCGVGACSRGAYACSGRRFACAGGSGPSAETCNGVDDDCDGVVDDVVGLGAPCAV